MDQKQTTAGNVVDWLGENAKQVDPAEVQETLQTTIPVLLADEIVEISFQSGRDYTIFTNYRFMKMDVVQGLNGGYKTAFTTVTWECIHAYAVYTAGSFFGRDMEMILYTNIIDMPYISQGFWHGKADLLTIQKILCNHILGEDTAPLNDPDLREGEMDHKGFGWFLDHQRPLDAVELNQVYHTNPPILRDNEQVERAFKDRRNITLFTNLRVFIIDPKAITGKRVELCDNQRPLDAVEINRAYHTQLPILRGNEQVEMAFEGHSDITLFTNLRVIIMDPKATTVKRIQYTTLPWKSIIAHAIRTAGNYAQVCFWTEQAFIPGRAGNDDCPPRDPEPFVSYLYVKKKLVYNKTENNLQLSGMNKGFFLLTNQSIQTFLLSHSSLFCW